MPDHRGSPQFVRSVGVGRAVQDDALDVERLADALYDEGLSVQDDDARGFIQLNMAAERIAARYARLRAASPFNASGDER